MPPKKLEFSLLKTNPCKRKLLRRALEPAKLKGAARGSDARRATKCLLQGIKKRKLSSLHSQIKCFLTPSLAMPVKSAPLCSASLRDGLRPLLTGARAALKKLPRRNGEKDAIDVSFKYYITLFLLLFFMLTLLPPTGNDNSRQPARIKVAAQRFILEKKKRNKKCKKNISGPYFSSALS